MGVRLTAHNGRGNKNGTFNVNHNDRNFDLSKAEHIDEERTKFNKYFHVYSNSNENKNLTFEEAEEKFYKDNFSDFIEERNKKSISEAHPERCQNIQSYRKSRKSCPEETIFCLGKKGDSIDTKLLTQILTEHINWRTHNFPNVRFLNIALHVDEQGVGHAHERHVYTAKDEKTNKLCVNQKKCLEQMNVKRQDLSRKEDRYNNAKTTFTKLCRENLFSICEKYGVEVIREPREKSKSGRKLNDYIAEKRKEELDKRENQLDKREENLSEKEKTVSDILSDITTLSKHKNNIKSVFNKAINSKNTQERNFYLNKSKSIVEAISETIDKATETAITANIINNNDNLSIDKDYALMTEFEKEEEETKAMLREL